MLTKEEEKFGKTIDQGLDILNGMEEEMKGKGEKVLSGANAFMLYDTYGFPLDLTKEILEEKGYSIDEDGFKAAMEEQRVKARTSREKMQPFTMRSIHPSHPNLWDMISFLMNLTSPYLQRRQKL